MLVTGDLHLSERTLHLLPKLALYLNTTAVANKCSSLVILGDVLHDNRDPRARIPARVLNALVDFISVLNFNHIYVLVGNHDMYTSSLSSIQFLKLVPTITVIDEPSYIEELNAIAIPYCKPERVIPQALLLKSEHPDAQYLFLHADGLGFKMTPNRVADQGVDFTHKVFGEFRAVLSGHYHDPQQSGNVYYVGSPYQTRRNETPAKRVVLLQGSHVLSLDVPSDISTRFVFLTADQLNRVTRQDVTYFVSDVHPEHLGVIQDLQSRGFKVVTSDVNVPELELDEREIDMESSNDFAVSLLEEVVERLRSEDDERVQFMRIIGEEVLLPFIKGRG